MVLKDKQPDQVLWALDTHGKSGSRLILENNPKTWLFMITHKPIFDYGPKSYEDDIHDEWGVPLYEVRQKFKTR